MYIPLLLSGLGWLVTILMPSPPLGPIVLTFASFGGVAILIEITRHETALHTVTILLGALTWFVDNLLWLLGWQIFQVVFVWQAFLVLTIAGERFKLRRVLRPSRAQQIADYTNLNKLRMWVGLLNEAAILLFIGLTVFSIQKNLTIRA